MTRPGLHQELRQQVIRDLPGYISRMQRQFGRCITLLRSMYSDSRLEGMTLFGRACTDLEQFCQLLDHVAPQDVQLSATTRWQALLLLTVKAFEPHLVSCDCTGLAAVIEDYTLMLCECWNSVQLELQPLIQAVPE